MSAAYSISQGADESSLPDFSDDERAYQEKSWNSMIGCCIARHFASEAYSKGEEKPLMNKVSSTSSRTMRANSRVLPTLHCLKPPFFSSKIIMEQHCETYKGMFKEQCYRITPKVLSGIEPGTVRAPRRDLDAAIINKNICKCVPYCSSLFAHHSLLAENQQQNTSSIFVWMLRLC